MRDIIEILNEVVEFKIGVMEKFIEERLNPLLDMGSPRAFMTRKLGVKSALELSEQQIQGMMAIFGEEEVVKMITKDKEKSIKASEEEVKAMEAG